MKRRKSLLLSNKAIERGEKVAVESGRSFSSVVEEQLLGIRLASEQGEEFWPGAPLKPIKRPGDARYEYLRKKHG